MKDTGDFSFAKLCRHVVLRRDVRCLDGAAVALKLVVAALPLFPSTAAWAVDDTYEFTVAARTGMFLPTGESPPLDFGELTSVGPPSINYYGVTAFKGDVGEVDGVWIYIPWTGEVRKETASFTNDHNYLNDVQINDSGWISTIRRTGNPLPAWSVALWNGGNSISVINEPVNSGRYTSVFSPALSNDSVPQGENEFNVAVGVYSLEFSGQNMAGLITPPHLGVQAFNELQVQDVGGPRIAEDGRSVARIFFNSAYRLMRFNYDFSQWTEIAATDPQYSDFEWIGERPGLSDNGKAVAFAARLNDGTTNVAMLSIEKDDGTAFLVQVAGRRNPHYWWDSELGFDAQDTGLFLDYIDDSSRVGVIHQELGAAGLADDSFVVHFMATPNKESDPVFFTPGMEFTDRRGLWTVQVDVIGFDESGGVKTRVHRPIAVAQFGDRAEDFGLPAEWNFDTNVSPPAFVGAGVTVDDALARQDFYQSPGDLTLSPDAERSLEAGNHRLAFRLNFPGGSAIVTAKRVGACMLPVRRQPQGGQLWSPMQLDSHPCYPGDDASELRGTIGARGCTLTVATMQLTQAAASLLEDDEIGFDDHFSMRTETPQSTNTFWGQYDDPSDINAIGFTAPGTCNSNGQSATGTDWHRSNGTRVYDERLLAQPAGLRWSPSDLNSSEESSDARSELYERLCVERAPISVRVKLGPIGFGHEVLVTGVVNDEFHIADPAASCGSFCADAAQTSARVLSDYLEPFELRGSMRLPGGAAQRGQQSDADGYMSFVTMHDVNFVVSDENGRIAGFMSEDPGDTIEEIPGSAVTADNNSDPEEVLPDLLPKRHIIIEGASSGAFDLIAVGNTEGNFAVSVFAQSVLDGVDAESTVIEGFAVPGESTEISLQVSGGGISGSITSTPVPNGIGQLVWEAEQAVLDAGLTVGNVVYQHDTSVPGYTVVEQQPAALSVAAGGTAVDLFVANGPDSDGDGWSDISDNCVELQNTDQRDTDGDLIGNACDSDIAQPNDCQVNFADLGVLKTAFFSADGDVNWNADADFDGDGAVSFSDLGIMKSFFFGPPGPSGHGNSCQSFDRDSANLGSQRK